MGKLLLAKGARVDQATNDGDTDLITSCMNGHQEVAKLLLANGAWADQAKNDGVPPLIMSSHNGHLRIVRLLDEHGADANLILADPAKSMGRGHVAKYLQRKEEEGSREKASVVDRVVTTDSGVWRG